MDNVLLEDVMLAGLVAAVMRVTIKCRSLFNFNWGTVGAVKLDKHCFLFKIFLQVNLYES
jgi:hypothetical protein